LTAVLAETVIGIQQPRIWSAPSYVSSAGGEAVELAALAGLHLDEWQQFVLVNALGERGDGRWAAPTVGLVVGRQNGKNAVLEARELAGLFLLGERVIVHSAHEQATSSEHFRRLLALIESVPEFDRRVLKASHGKGSEAIELRGGQRVLFKTRTGGGGRGFSVDLLVFDEAMILSPGSKAALIPTMAARSVEGNTQTWYAGSAVDQLNPKHDGVELARIREGGIAGRDKIAYFEWSAPGESPDQVTDDVAADPAVWALANPGLGVRISAEWVEHERTVELGAREFAVERLGIGDWPATDGSGDAPISVDAWDELADSKSAMSDPVCFAFDVAPDRSVASIAAAGKRKTAAGGTSSIAHVEIIDNRRGTGWIVARLKELHDGHSPLGIVCDGVGPAASLVAEIERELGIEVRVVNAKEHAHACGTIYDRVEQNTLRHLGTHELRAAVKGATKRTLGDAWAWSRRNSSVDISPLVAATLALWGAENIPPTNGEPLVAWG
jgi:hypothetical protein